MFEISKIRCFIALCVCKGILWERFLYPIQRKPVSFDSVHIDHFGPFMKSVSKNSYLLVLLDGFIKFVITKATRTIKARENHKRSRLSFYYSEVSRVCGREEYKTCIEDVATPRAHGQVERVNSSLVRALATSAGTDARWDEKVPGVVWGLNHTVSGGTEFSPVKIAMDAKADLQEMEEENERVVGHGSHERSRGNG